MNKLLIVIFLGTMLLPALVSADTFRTNINLSITPTNLTITFENGQTSYSLGNFTSSYTQNIDIIRTISTSSCQAEINSLNANISKIISEKENYFPLYLSCFGNLTDKAAQVKRLEEKAGFEQQYTTCAKDLELASGRLSDEEIDSKECETALETTKKDKESIQGNQWLFLILVGVGGFFAGREWHKRSFARTDEEKERRPDQ